MARIRSIKPEFWTSEQIAECSPSARLLFIGMWTFSDDRGVHPASLRRLKMEVFPGDGITTDDVGVMVDELMRARLVGRFSNEGRSFLAVTGWHHQKIERPTYKYPKPPDVLEFADLSPTVRRLVADESPPDVDGDMDIDVSLSEDQNPSSPLKIKAMAKQVADMPIPETLRGDDFGGMWKSWITHRTEKKKPMTPTSAEKLLNKLSDWGLLRSLAALDHSIANGWTGVFEPTESAKGKPNGKYERPAISSINPTTGRESKYDQPGAGTGF